MRCLTLLTSIFLSSLIISFTGCTKTFDYSPYQTFVDKDERNTTSNQLNKILINSSDTFQPFRFALISDNHLAYDSFTDALDLIAQDSSLSFVLHGGDIADNGFLREFEVFHNHMADLPIPFLTVIGNHDYLSNGEDVYAIMFGERNYSFVYNDIKFVVFDNVTLESNQVPEFEWIEKELTDGLNHTHTLTLSHIPPTSNTFTIEQQERLSSLMKNFKVTLSMHGHIGKYSFEESFEDGVRYLTVDLSGQRTFAIIEVQLDSVIVNRIDY
ncbi:metallophosphoesterase [Limibacter armeniacum]|uniref:metallophosphoesterase family protein n=1 Tax=Limibacter armeniacum TaxID=466084 RepID=UPI002FE650F7